MSLIARLLRDTRGATAIEYGLIMACVFLVALIAISNVGSEAIRMWDDVSNEVVTASKQS